MLEIEAAILGEDGMLEVGCDHRQELGLDTAHAVMRSCSVRSPVIAMSLRTGRVRGRARFLVWLRRAGSALLSKRPCLGRAERGFPEIF